MWSAAIASSSPVVTPGRTAALTAAMAPATTRPAARMSSISCGVLIWIMRPLHFASSGRRVSIPVAICRLAFLSRARLLPRGPGALEGGHRACGHFFDLADGVDAGEQSLLLVPARQRRRLFPVDLQPVPHRLRLVVPALHHLPVDQHPAAGEPAHQLVL